MELQLFLMLVIPLVMYLSVEKVLTKRIVLSTVYTVILYGYIFTIIQLDNEMYVANFLFLFMASIGLYVSTSLKDAPKYILVMSLFIHISNMFLLFISNTLIVALFMYVIVASFLTFFWINIKKNQKVDISSFILYILLLAVNYYMNIYQFLNITIILLATILMYKKFTVKKMILLAALLFAFNIVCIVSSKVEFYSIIIAIIIFPMVSMEKEIKKYNKNVFLKFYMLFLILTIILGVVYLYFNNGQIIHVSYYVIFFSYLWQAVIRGRSRSECII